MSDPIWRWNATRIAAAIKQREISAVDALDACLARMAEVNPKLNAVTVDLSELRAKWAGALSVLMAGSDVHEG